MNHRLRFLSASLLLLSVGFLLSSCEQRSDERLITILATNDIHGGIEPHAGPDLTGGLAMFSGAVKSIKEGLRKKYGRNAGVLVLDAGDQFQGTLISNYTEGALVFSAMGDVGYDAVITGNHDYDFGPHGWLVDSVKDQDPSAPDHDPRGVIKDLASKAAFPILSANTYLKNSIVDRSGKPVDVDSTGCTPKDPSAQIDWSEAKEPAFLKRYLIKKVAGVRVAIIGIDNPETPLTTTPDNVTDLCFRDEFSAYKQIRAELQGKADVFVMVLHDGNISNETNATDLAKKLYSDSPANVDAIVSGHTHVVYTYNINSIPVIQSGHGGDRFGRIDLVYKMSTHSLERDKVKAVGGIPLNYESCATSIQDFCKVLPGNSGVSYEGVPVQLDQRIVDKITAEKKALAPMADRVLGETESTLSVDRINESPLADAMTDTFRKISKADIAFMNTGGLRTSIKKGSFTYSDLFEVLPFNNHGYIVGPMTATKLVALLNRSIQTCGSYGALMESGLKVSFTRDCAHQAVDPKAQLVHVETLSGEVIVDAAQGIGPKDSRVFNVATLDFLAEGGSGYTDFAGTPLISDLGILREVMAEALEKNPAQWDGATDGRWEQINSAP